MRIRARDPKRRYPCSTHPIPARPRSTLSHYPQRIWPHHMPRGHLRMQRRRHPSPPQRQQHLHQTDHPSSRLRMPNIRFHRPQPDRPHLRPPHPIGGRHGLHLNGVPQHRPCPVALHQIHICGPYPRRRQRCPDHPFLRRTIRCTQPIARPVLIDRTALHQPIHTTSPRHRIRQPFQHHQCHPLPPCRPISALPKRLTPPIHRQPPLPRKLRENMRICDDGGSASERE
jgi:hypothetical protein